MSSVGSWANARRETILHQMGTIKLQENNGRYLVITRHLTVLLILISQVQPCLLRLFLRIGEMTFLGGANRQVGAPRGQAVLPAPPFAASEQDGQGSCLQTPVHRQLLFFRDLPLSTVTCTTYPVFRNSGSPSRLFYFYIRDLPLQGMFPKPLFMFPLSLFWPHLSRP